MTKLSSFSIGALAGLTLITTAACGGVDAETTANDSIGATAQALTGSPLSNAREFVWKAKDLIPKKLGEPGGEQFEAGLELMPDSTHLCVLSGMSGNFAGADEYVSITRGGGFWSLYGRANQKDVEVHALCYERSRFRFPAGVTLKETQLKSAQVKSGSRAGPLLATGPILNEKTVDLGTGRAASFLWGLGGEFDGYSDEASIEQGDALSDSFLYVKNGSKWAQDTLALGGGLIRSDRGSLYTSFNGQPTLPNGVAGEVSARSGEQALLEASGKGLCFLTSVTGNFGSASDSVRLTFYNVYRDFGFWQLEVKGSPDLSASASCIDYDQTFVPSVE